jgi:hypothetical protein
MFNFVIDVGLIPIPAGQFPDRKWESLRYQETSANASSGIGITQLVGISWWSRLQPAEPLQAEACSTRDSPSELRTFCEDEP